MQKKLKESVIKLNSEQIKAQYIVPYRANSLSRYKHIDEVKLADDKILKATLSPIDMGVFPYEAFTFYTVPKHEENRLDIIAYKIYGKASMYWAIAYVNNIKDPLDIPEGTILAIPTISTLKRFPNPLS